MLRPQTRTASQRTSDRPALVFYAAAAAPPQEVESERVGAGRQEQRELDTEEGIRGNHERIGSEQQGAGCDGHREAAPCPG
jgi:hypothetical protein